MKRHLVLAVSSLCLVSTLADAARREGGDDARGNWPTAPSAPPTAAEWEARMRVNLGRTYGDKAASCDVRLNDEWIRVRCAFKTSAITQLGGAHTGVQTVIEPPSADRLPGAGELIFPVRPGERRVFLLWTLGPGYDGPLTVVPAVVVQSQWLAGSENPSITLTDALHEPVATKTHPRLKDG
jgi:hypothetical protein